MATPHPTPTKLRVLRGNPGKRPLPQHEAQPKPRLPQAPVFLSMEGKREWTRTGKRLLGLGLMTEIDTAALAAYCQAWGRWRGAEEKLNEFGVVIKVGASLQVSPYLSVANKAMEQMTRLLIEFGMTPSSRSRVSVSDAQKEDPFEEIRQGARKHG